MEQDAVDDIPQFTDISRPNMFIQCIYNSARQLWRMNFILTGKLLTEMLYKERDVIPTLPQRRHADDNSSQSIIEVTTQQPS